MSVAEVFHHVFSAMHTRFSVVLPGVNRSDGEKLASEIESHVLSQERLLSRFDAESPLADLNRRAGSRPVMPPTELWDILVSCRDHWRRTRGVFDIAQAARTDLFRKAAGGLSPSEDDLKYAAEHCGFEKVLFDETACTIRFKAPGLKLDLGGIGKGIALDLAVRTLASRNVSCGLLSFGESSIAVIGMHPAGKPWPIGVADLFIPNKSWHRFDLCDAAMSTSGNRDIQGHIINPRGGGLVEGRRTLSVACPSATEAEVLSKSLMLTPVADRENLFKEYPKTQAVEICYLPGNGGWVGKVEWKYEPSTTSTPNL